MRDLIDFSSWHGLFTTLLGLVLFTLVVVGLRLLLMLTVQQRRERENRQINERLRTLIAAYKTLGSSFTGDLAVDPAHLKDLRRREGVNDSADALRADAEAPPGGERRRRMRDAVEAALSDVVLLGTEEQVRLAVQAANDMVAGRRVETAALVVSLRDFIREVLDLEAVPANLRVPPQGPARPSGAGARGGRGEGGGGRGEGGGGGGRGEGGGGRRGGAAGGGGTGVGLGLGRADAPDS